jgi:glycosyltransferase involved in cell wall biosynthesis
VRRAHQRAADEFPDARFAIEDRIVAGRPHRRQVPQEEDLIRHYNADPARITIIQGGFDPGEFWPIASPLARVTLGLPPVEPVGLQLGRMVPRNGVDTAIRGLARLRSDHGVAARLLIIGDESHDTDSRSTPEIGRLWEIARAEGVGDATVFVGRRGPHLLKYYYNKYYYNAADVFITTPWYEPFGCAGRDQAAPASSTMDGIGRQ